MFRLENITKIYSRRGKDVKACAAASLQVSSGEYTAIVGPSGSVKTTVLSSLVGMVVADTGQVWIDGKSLFDLPVTVRARGGRVTI